MARKSREEIFNQNQLATQALVEKQERLWQELSQVRREIEIQKQKEHKTKLKWKHPYIDAIHPHLNFNMDLVRICLSYLPENFCVTCGKMRLGSPCIKCDITSNYDKKYSIPITYTILGPMKRVCHYTNHYEGSIGPYNDEPDYKHEIFCFAPTNRDDKKLVKHWSKLINKREKFYKWDDRCPNGKPNHLSLNLGDCDPSDVEFLTSGSVLKLYRLDKGCHDREYGYEVNLIE